MTTDEIDNLEAGVEIDRMVAEACEVRLDNSGLIIPQLTDCKEVQFSPHRRSFKPSTDWNDAMEAAEKFGLFHYLDVKIAQMGKSWVVLSYDPHRKHGVILAKHTLGQSPCVEPF